MKKKFWRTIIADIGDPVAFPRLEEGVTDHKKEGYR
jgi:hypothetical protein